MLVIAGKNVDEAAQPRSDRPPQRQLPQRPHNRLVGNEAERRYADELFPVAPNQDDHSVFRQVATRQRQEPIGRIERAIAQT